MICLKIQKEMFKHLLAGKDIDIEVSTKEGDHWRISLEPMEPHEVIQIILDLFRYEKLPLSEN